MQRPGCAGGAEAGRGPHAQEALEAEPDEQGWPHLTQGLASIALWSTGPHGFPIPLFLCLFFPNHADSSVFPPWRSRGKACGPPVLLLVSHGKHHSPTGLPLCAPLLQEVHLMEDFLLCPGEQQDKCTLCVFWWLAGSRCCVSAIHVKVLKEFHFPSPLLLPLG